VGYGGKRSGMQGDASAKRGMANIPEKVSVTSVRSSKGKMKHRDQKSRQRLTRQGKETSGKEGNDGFRCTISREDSLGGVMGLTEAFKGHLPEEAISA